MGFSSWAVARSVCWARYYHLFGKVTDRELGELLGMQREVVSNVRRRLGVPTAFSRGLPDRLGRKHIKGIPQPSLSRPERIVWRNHLTNARKRSLETTISSREYFVLAYSPCHYCGADPVEKIVHSGGSSKYAKTYRIHAHGVDRYDNGIGYVHGNCVACCKRCNVSKSDHSAEEFIEHCKRVVSHLRCQ